MTNCPNCGAPITGSVCEYCGTRHWITVFVPASPPPQMLCDTLLLSRQMQQCRSAELENLQTRIARESVNALDSLINSYERNRNAAQRI
jgi:hypothetical protein